MAESDDDYMSDKLLIECEKKDVRPGLLYNKTHKRKHELFKKQHEERKQKPKSYQEQEKEIRNKGLSTAIPPENKGFKLLEQMGYKVGSGLGKSGIIEPVSIKPKEDNAGVGRKTHIKEVIEKNRDLQKKSFQVTQEQFRSANAERQFFRMLQKDYRNAQRTCEELDLQSGIEVPRLPFFWSKETRKSLKKKNKGSEESYEKEDQEEEEEDEGELEEVNEPRLCDMIMYLRTQYYYCIYCADYIERGAVSTCPGYFRKEHED